MALHSRAQLPQSPRIFAAHSSGLRICESGRHAANKRVPDYSRPFSVEVPSSLCEAERSLQQEVPLMNESDRSEGNNHGATNHSGGFEW